MRAAGRGGTARWPTCSPTSPRCAVAEALVVEQAGYATVQDLGRPGLAPLGVSANGAAGRPPARAADAHAARTANVLVGNRPGAPLLEATASALTVRARRPLLLAVTGAAGRV